MKNDKSLDRILYEAYCERAEWKSAVTGASLPQWEACSDLVKDCWWAAAEAAIEWASDALDQPNKAARPAQAGSESEEACD